MKSVLKYAAGIALGTAATPLTAFGLGAQFTARGVIRTGSAINTMGEKCELKGLQYGDSGAQKIAESKAEMKKSKAERKAERIAKREEKAADTAARRAQRVLDLKAAAFVREQLATLTKGERGELMSQLVPQQG